MLCARFVARFEPIDQGLELLGAVGAGHVDHGDRKIVRCGVERGEDVVDAVGVAAVEPIAGDGDNEFDRHVERAQAGAGPIGELVLTREGQVEADVGVGRGDGERAGGDERCGTEEAGLEERRRAHVSGPPGR